MEMWATKWGSGPEEMSTWIGISGSKFSRELSSLESTDWDQLSPSAANHKITSKYSSHSLLFYNGECD